MSRLQTGRATVVAAADDRAREDGFRAAVVEGLSRPHKAIPCAYLYDAQGSALFDEICRLPEYYPTRTELKILRDNVGEIAALAGPAAALIEFGSGSSLKTRVLLDEMRDLAAYVPIDVSHDHLQGACEALARDYPRLRIMGVAADYMQPFSLPALPAATRTRLGFFPGSTIGNLLPTEAHTFLAKAARLLGPGGALLIGVDLVKDTAMLEAAYDDSAGVTARFTLNLLRRINAELGGDFDLDRFAHDASYNAKASRIEIYVRSLADQTVRVAGRTFRFAEGERIHTEYSYKYTVDGFHGVARTAGFAPVHTWTDADRLFSVHYLRVA